MSNNLIRKGLAFVATASLALAGVVGISSPANAAPSSLVLQSSFGPTSAIQTSATQSGVLGHEFNLAGSFPGADANDRIKYLVSGTSVSTASVTVSSRFVATIDNLQPTDAAGTASDTVYRLTGSTPAHHTVTAGETGQVIIAPSMTANRADKFFQFNFNLSAVVDATTVVTITPFVDSVGNNNAINTGELTGTPIVLTLNKASEVTFTSQLVAPTTSSQVLRADVTANKDVNHSQWLTVSSSPVRVQFYVNGTQTGGTNRAVVYTSTAVRASAVSDQAISIPAGAVVSVQQSIALGTYAASGTTGTVTAGNTASLGTLDNAGGLVVSNDNIRLGDGRYSVEILATPKAGVKKAGQTVTFKIEENAANSLAAAAAVTAGGKSLTNSSSTTVQSISVDVLTDADGYANLPISYTGLVATNAIKVTASAISSAGGTISAASKTHTAVASVATRLVDIAKIAPTAVRSVVAGGQVAIDFRIIDQFGQVPTGVYQANIALENGAVGTPNAVYSTITPITNGAFSVRFNDNSTGTAVSAGSSYEVAVTVNKQATNGTFPTDGSAGGLAKNDDAEVYVGPAQAAATLTLAGSVTQNVARDAVAYSSVDTRITRESVVLPALVNGATLSGTALGSNGTLQAGVAVTLSAPGLLFSQNGVYSVGSITVHTTEAGAWGSVVVQSNRTGAQTITATSGAATKTLVVAFASTAYADGIALTMSAPKSIKMGRTLTMSVTLKDKFGNGVSANTTRLSVKYSGPGFEIRDPAAAELAATTGVYTLRVLLGAGDTGVATMSVVFDPTEGLTVADTQDDRVTASAATWVGPIANAKAGAKAGRVVVEAYRAFGKTVSVFVGSTRVASFVSNKADFSAVVRGVKAGTRNVSVRLSGPGQDFTGAITVK